MNVTLIGPKLKVSMLPFTVHVSELQVLLEYLPPIRAPSLIWQAAVDTVMQISRLTLCQRTYTSFVTVLSQPDGLDCACSWNLCLTKFPCKVLLMGFRGANWADLKISEPNQSVILLKKKNPFNSAVWIYFPTISIELLALWTSLYFEFFIFPLSFLLLCLFTD